MVRRAIAYIQDDRNGAIVRTLLAAHLARFLDRNYTRMMRCITILNEMDDAWVLECAPMPTTPSLSPEQETELKSIGTTIHEDDDSTAMQACFYMALLFMVAHDRKLRAKFKTIELVWDGVGGWRA